ncbi:MAG: hypothetical protein IJN42_07275, partial [Clostridia bacterium]|nr:hypothetical protein [Clostridia bacterium]
ALQLYPDASQSNWENMQSQGFTVQAYALTQSWMAENVTAGANVPSHDATIVDYLLTPATPLTNGEVSPCYWDITQMVDEWYFTGNNYGVMLKADKESGYTGNCVAQFASSTYDLFAENNHLAYPTVRIIYLNMLGLEDYWTYRALDAGVAGTAYINDFTGGLSIVTPLAAVDSAHTPLNVSLVYAPESNDPNINALKVGNHFMLNLQCYVKPVTIGGVQKYKYVDSDGTVHYFEDENGEWKDDSGLGLTITVSEDYYTIRDKKDNIMEFYADTGRLCKIKDSVGNITQLYYTVQDGKYYLSSVTNGTHTITFERENNNTGSRVYRIHYPDPDSADGKRFVQFTYTPSNSNIYHLTQYVKQNGIEKPTHIVNYSCSNNLVDQIISCPYDAENTPDSLSGTTLIFDYNTVGEGTARRRRITAYRMAAHANGELEKKQTPEGEVVNWRYYYDVSYHHRATRYTSRIKTDGGTYNNELYLFDSSGRTISVQDQDGHAAYQEHGISGGAKNKVTFASDTQRHVANLLKNHGFESGNATNLSGWEKLGGSSDNAAIKGTTENEPTYVGNKAMKV